MNEKKKAFIMYNDYGPALSMLSDDAAGRLLKAIYSYIRTGEEPELQDCERIVFLFIKNNIDRDSEKYEAVCKARSEAAKKRSAKNNSSDEQTEAEQNGANVTIADNTEQIHANDTDKETENKKEKANVTDHDNENRYRKRAASAGRRHEPDPELAANCAFMFSRALNCPVTVNTNDA